MVEEEKLQEKLLAYRIIESRLENLLRQRDMLMNRIIEIETTLSSLKETKRGKNAAFSIGSGAHVLGKIGEEDKIIVEIGAGVALEKTVKEAEEILSKRNEEVERVLTEVQKGITQLSDGLEKLTPEIQELIDKTKEKAD